MQNSVAKMVQLTARSKTYRLQLQSLVSIVQFIKPRKYLEVGAYEGRSAFLFSVLAALQEQAPVIHLTSVDSWQGGDEHREAGVAMGSVEGCYDAVIQECKPILSGSSVFEKIKGLSSDSLASIRNRQNFYDLILVDAGHKAKDVLADMVHAWPLLRPGGIMILDDYTWIPRHQVNDLLINAPKLGIDSFLNCYADELTILSNLPLLQMYVLKSPIGNSPYQALALELLPVPEVFEHTGLI